MAFLATTACSENTGPKSPADGLPNIPGLTVSGPVTIAAGGVRALVAAASVDESAVYVSLAPGSVPSGVRARIQDVASRQAITTEVVAGGFDPVAIPAGIGDTLTVEVIGTAGDAIRARYVVTPRRPPVVVRTDPPPRKKDVPLNAIVVIVFSEPIDGSTLGGAAVVLRQGATSVPGALRFADPAHLKVEFQPAALLDAHTDYELVLSQDIRAVNGVALGSVVRIPFSTGMEQAANLVFASVSVGLVHTCGVTNEGVAYCWGENTHGALGDGTTVHSAIPVRVAGGLTFASVSAGRFHTCGVTLGHALYCWGAGDGYALGTSFTPASVGSGQAFATVSVGDFNACAVTPDGSAFCWGEGGMGELGNGTKGSSRTPVKVAGGLTFATVSAGVYSICGVTTAQAAYCWGSNALGGLGTSSSVGPEQCYDSLAGACSTVPVAVTGDHRFKQVGAKVYAACGLTTSGAAYCWGSNLNDALGLGTITGPDQCPWDASYIVACVRLPVTVPGSPTFVSMTTSEQYACGITSTGDAYCWGHPQNTGDLLSNTGPVVVPGGLTFASLSAGPYSTCGITASHVTYCWGFNEKGQLGDGTTNDSSRPVEVVGQHSALSEATLQIVEVTTVTSGTHPDPDGYGVLNDEWDYDIGDGITVPAPTNGTVNLYLRPGTHVLSLIGVAPNCGGESLDDRTVTVPRGVAVTRVAFQVVCKDP